MTPADVLLVERVTTAHRERARDGSIRWAPAFFDLDADGRRAAYDETFVQRAVERALDPDGFSTSVHALLARLENRSAG